MKDTKIFGDINGNHIEVRTRVGLFGKKQYNNALRTVMSISGDENRFRMVQPEEDADIILLKGALVLICENGNVIKNPSFKNMAESFGNEANMEEAIQFLKLNNKLGEYAAFESMDKEALEKRVESLYKEIELIEAEIEKKGN